MNSWLMINFSTISIVWIQKSRFGTTNKIAILHGEDGWQFEFDSNSNRSADLTQMIQPQRWVDLGWFSSLVRCCWPVWQYQSNDWWGHSDEHGQCYTWSWSLRVCMNGQCLRVHYQTSSRKERLWESARIPAIVLASKGTLDWTWWVIALRIIECYLG